MFLPFALLTNFSLNDAEARTCTNSLLLYVILSTMHWLIHIAVIAVFTNVNIGFDVLSILAEAVHSLVVM